MNIVQLPSAIHTASQNPGSELTLALEGVKRGRDQQLSNEINVSGFQICLKQRLTLQCCLDPYYAMGRYIRKPALPWGNCNRQRLKLSTKQN